MLFNSLQYLLFFPLVVFVYFALPHRYRATLLVVASLYFYMCWRVPFVLVLILLILVDYFAGVRMGKASDHAQKRFYLTLSLVANLGMLFVFKYFNFFNENIAALFTSFGWPYPLAHLNVILPVGISFHTFQAMSYTLDVYYGRIQPEYRLKYFSLFVSYFPQLVAGPIERADRLLPQFDKVQTFDYGRVTDGLKLVAWGFFKKLVISDRLSAFVSPVYDNPMRFEGPTFVLATFFFAIQIYCDFSGYSDIAIGSSQVLGIRLSENFNRPYFAKSISEFWRRWHISLSSWFRDYVYIPLGGSRVAPMRQNLNLMITFLLSGLWHGANWTYVVWGALNGLYLVIGKVTWEWRARLHAQIGLTKHPQLQRWIQVGVTFSLICFAWIFFRARSMTDAWYIVTHLGSGWGELVRGLGDERYWRGHILVGQRFWEFGVAWFAIAFLFTIHGIQRHGSIRHMLSERPWPVRWGIYSTLMASILFFGVFRSADFIYFQF